MIAFTPREGTIKYVSELYGPVTYEALGEQESLGGLICTRNQIFKVPVIRAEYSELNKPIFNKNNIKVVCLGKTSPIQKDSKVERRKKYILAAKISGQEISDYSKILGEWGDNPRTELRTRKLREIYELCRGSEIPIWMCDTLEPVINWGESDKSGLTEYLKSRKDLLGLPLYRIPPIDFKQIDLTCFPETEKKIIESGKLNGCKSFAEQTIKLMQIVLDRFQLTPILIDQYRLREAGAYITGINVILSRLKEFENIFGEGNLFRVECKKCGKYIYNTTIDCNRISGVCNGTVKQQRSEEYNQKYEGCGSILNEDIDYLYKFAIPNGKIMTAVYMSNSDVGIFFPDKEFVSENIACGELEKIVKAVALFESGVPDINKTAWLTLDGKIENMFEVLDNVPKIVLQERMQVSKSISRIDIKTNSLEGQIIAKIKKYNLPTDSRILADVIYSLNGQTIDFNKLGISFDEDLLDCLRCLGKIRKNKIVTSQPSKRQEDYQKFMKDTYLTEQEISELRKFLTDQNAPVRTIMEVIYLASLIT